MKLKTLLKSTIVGMAMGSTLLMNGCSTIPTPEIEIECTVTPEGVEKCTIKIVVKNESGNFNDLAQIMNEDLALDFSNSPNALLNQQFNIGNITLKSNDLPIATKTASYQKAGQEIVAADSADIVNWLASHNGQADEIVLTISELQFQALIGANTMVVELTQNGNVIAGGSASEYISPFSPEALQIGYQ